MSACLPEELVDFIESGVSMGVGATNADLRPECARAVGARVASDRRAVTVFLPMAVVDRLAPCLVEGAPVAVTFSRIHDHRTVQLKGRVRSTRPAEESERELLLTYLAAFAEQASMAGLPRAVVRKVVTYPALAVTFGVEALFEQTPGPEAGARYEASS